MDRQPNKTKITRMAWLMLSSTLLIVACSAVSQNSSSRDTQNTREIRDRVSPNPQPLSSLPGKPEVINGDHHCNLGLTEFAHWIDSASELEHWLQRIQQSRFPASPPTLPQLDFQQQAVLLIYMGQQSSGGYAISLASKPMQTNDDSASLFVKWETPQPGMMTTQALTSPCSVITFPLGPFKQLNIIDQKGNQRFVLKRP